MPKLQKCAYCKKIPTVIRTGGIYYVQCTCGHYDMYEFCALREINAIDLWNITNTRRGEYDG